MNRENIIKKVNERISGNIVNLSSYIEKLIAYDILASDRALYEVDHALDPPWDCSGHLVKSGSYEISDDIHLKDYLKFYTGASYASYAIGCGITHEVKSGWLEDQLIQALFDIQDNVVREEVEKADSKSLYQWLECKVPKGNLPDFNDFSSNLEEYTVRICSKVIDDIDDDTLAFDYPDIWEKLPGIKENPSLKTIAERHYKEIEEILNNQEIVKERMAIFIEDIKKTLPETESFFNGRKLTKEGKNKDFLDSFCKTFTEEEISLIAYFEPEHFSNSLLKFADLIKDIVREERENMENFFKCEVKFEEAEAFLKEAGHETR